MQQNKEEITKLQTKLKEAQDLAIKRGEIQVRLTKENADLKAEIERLKVVAANAFDKCEALTCALLASESKRPLSPKQEALLDEAKEQQLRAALRETREALKKLTMLVVTADTEGGQIIEPEWLPVLKYNDTIASVLARYADLAGEAEHV